VSSGHGSWHNRLAYNGSWHNRLAYKTVSQNPTTEYIQRSASMKYRSSGVKVSLIPWPLLSLHSACSIWRLVTLAYFSAFAMGAVRTYCYTTLKENSDKFTAALKVTI
jgi:hypothetical protein